MGNASEPAATDEKNICLSTDVLRWGIWFSNQRLCNALCHSSGLAEMIHALTGCSEIRSQSSALIRHTINAIKARGIPVVETGLYDFSSEDLFSCNTRTQSVENFENEFDRHAP